MIGGILCPPVRASDPESEYRSQTPPDTLHPALRTPQHPGLRGILHPAQGDIFWGACQSVTMRFVCLVLFCLHGIIAQQYEAEHYNPTDIPFYYDYEGEADIIGGQVPVHESYQVLPQQGQQHVGGQYPLQPQHGYEPQQQQQTQQEEIPVPTQDAAQTEPTEPGPLDCREEQYPCTRLYSVHKPCKQCLNEICFYSLKRMYVVNKEICLRTVCAHEELLRADLCRDKFSRCGVMASSGLCGSVGSHCTKSCGGC